jgi:serine/threonine-protein kinase HipA
MQRLTTCSYFPFKEIGLLTYDAGIELPTAESSTIDDILKYSGKEPLFPTLLEKYYLRNMISGVQPKVSIPNLERTVQQSGVIVKASDSEFNLLTVNEYVCMNAAKFCGLNTSMTYLSENLETFIIERFDKVNNTKLGFEDFTTLMKKGRDPDKKYKSSYETLLKATYLFTHRNKEVEIMYKYIVFNCLIGNDDAHLKNFALTYSADMNKVKDSPIYDVTHTIIYDTIDNKMALKLNKSKNFPDKKMLIKLGNMCEPRIVKPKEIIEARAEGFVSTFKRVKSSKHCQSIINWRNKI